MDDDVDEELELEDDEEVLAQLMVESFQPGIMACLSSGHRPKLESFGDDGLDGVGIQRRVLCMSMCCLEDDSVGQDPPDLR